MSKQNSIFIVLFILILTIWYLTRSESKPSTSINNILYLGQKLPEVPSTFTNISKFSSSSMPLGQNSSTWSRTNSSSVPSSSIPLGQNSSTWSRTNSSSVPSSSMPLGQNSSTWSRTNSSSMPSSSVPSSSMPSSSVPSSSDKTGTVLDLIPPTTDSTPLPPKTYPDGTSISEKNQNFVGFQLKALTKLADNLGYDFLLYYKNRITPFITNPNITQDSVNKELQISNGVYPTKNILFAFNATKTLLSADNNVKKLLDYCKNSTSNECTDYLPSSYIVKNVLNTDVTSGGSSKIGAGWDQYPFNISTTTSSTTKDIIFNNIKN